MHRTTTTGDLARACWHVLALGLLLGATTVLRAQEAPGAAPARRIITAEAYDRWQTLDGMYAQLSSDGQWAVYEIGSAHHTEVVIRHTRRTTEYRVSDAQCPGNFSADSRYFVCVLRPLADAPARPGEARPATPALRVLTLASGQVELVPGVSAFTLAPGKAPLLLYQLPRGTSPPAGATPDGAVSPAASQPSEIGAPLVVRALGTTHERRFADVTSYAVDPTGRWLVYAVASADRARDGVYLHSLAQQWTTRLATAPGPYGSFAFDGAGTQVAFLGPVAVPAEGRAGRLSQALYYARLRRGAIARRVVAPTALGDTLQVIADGGCAFTRAGNALLFGVVASHPRRSAAPHRPARDSTAPARDTATLELWDTRAPYLPPQLRHRHELSGMSPRWSTAIYWPAEERWVRLGTAERPHVTVNDDARVGVAVTDAPYAVASNWGALQYDVYAVNTRTGRHTLIRRHTGGGPTAPRATPERVRLPQSMHLSPGGTYLLFYERERWWSYHLATGELVDLTGALGLRRFERDQDTDLRDNLPADLVGWLPQDTRVLLHDRLDLWSLDPRGRAPARNLTAGAGAADTLQFRAEIVGRRRGGSYLNPAEPLLLRAVNLRTRATGFWRLRLDETTPPVRLIMAPAELRIVRPTPGQSGYLLTRESYREFPDLWFTERLEAPVYTRLTQAQPQQAEYRWGTAELVHFPSTTGAPLAGVLYKPEDFDSTKQYPLVVSVYERQSVWFHHYQAPRPSNGTITPVNYVSKGYLVLRPDITYTIGQPCASAVAAVVGAVQALVARGFVDPKRIGLTGHSFGGYETVCLLTRTSLFRAAIAGAPAVNLISSYGTYSRDGRSWTAWTEVGQARMGTTPWDAPTVYVENSPIFHVQHIRTPLLLMHNNADDNIPWTQGLELFTALRRLGKEAYLATYPGEGHGLRERANQLDWDRRSQAFFDYYLMAGPRPDWMGAAPPPHLEAAK